MKKSIITLAATVLLATVALTGCDDHRTRTVVVPAPQQQQYDYDGDGYADNPVVVQQQPSTVVVAGGGHHDSGVGSFVAGAMVGHVLSNGIGRGNNTTVINNHNNSSLCKTAVVDLFLLNIRSVCNSTQRAQENKQYYFKHNLHKIPSRKRTANRNTITIITIRRSLFKVFRFYRS